MPNPIRKYTYYLKSIFELLTGFENPLLVVRIFLKMPLPGTKVIRLRQGGLQFVVRGAMDVWSLKETFLDRFYERYGTLIEDAWTCIDIGGGIGEFTLFVADGYPRNKVYAFEPFYESFELLEENLKRNRITNAQVFQEAIGGESGVVCLDLTGGEPLQFQSHPSKSSEQAITVPCLSLADALERLQIQHCDLMKLDCEGAEYDILFKTPDEVLKRVRRMVMEYHDGITSFTHRDLESFLRAKGFTVHTYPNFVHDNLGYLYAYRA